MSILSKIQISSNSSKSPESNAIDSNVLLETFIHKPELFWKFYKCSQVAQPQGLTDFVYNCSTFIKDKIYQAYRGPFSTTRDIGISVVRKLTSMINSILNVITPHFSDFLSPVIRAFRDSLVGFIPKIWTLANETLSTARKTICTMVACSLAGLVIICPSEYLGFMGKVFLGALAAITYFSESYISCGVSVGLFIMLKAMTSKYQFNIPVNINQNIATPQNFKEDTKALVLDAVSISVLLTAGFTGLEFPTDSKSWDNLLKRHSLLHRAYGAWEFGADKISEIFDRTANYVFKYILGKEYTSFNYISEVENLYLEVMTLCRLEVNILIGRDSQLALKIERLYMQYLHLCRVYANNRLIYTRLQKIGGPLTDYYRRVTDKNPKAHVMRKEPVCIAICGGTGIGKSYMMNRLQQDLLKITGAFSTDAPMENSVYARASEQEFWDGYNGQSIAIYDDFGQRVDSISNPNLEFFELIRAVNIFPYPLHTAALQDKANTPFTSDFVILTTNLHNYRAESIRSEEAFTRRIHLNIQMFIKKEVSDDPDAQQLGYGRKLLNAQKLLEYQQTNNLPSSDVSHLIFRDGTDNLTYDQFVVKVSLLYKKHLEAFNQRQQNNQSTSHNTLPRGAFSADNQWIATPQSSTSSSDESDTLSTLSVPSAYWTENDVDDFENEMDWPSQHVDEYEEGPRRATIEQIESVQRRIDVTRYIQSIPIPNRETFRTPWLLFRADRVFNGFIRRNFIEPLSDNCPRLRQTLMSLMHSLDEIRVYSAIRFSRFNTYKYWITAALGVAVIGVFTCTNFFPAPLDTKMPKLSFILGVVGSVTAATFATQFGSLITVSTITANLISMPFLYFNTMVQHSKQHQTFVPHCKDCDEHKKTLDQIPDALKVYTPDEILTQINPQIPNVESSIKSLVAQKTPLLESQMRQPIVISQPVIESELRKPTTALQQPTIESVTRVQNAQQTPLLESVMKAQIVKDAPTLESKISTHQPLTAMFPESGRTLDDKRKKKVQVESAKPEGILCAQLEPIKAIIRRNTWILTLVDDIKKYHIGTVVAIKGRKALANFHYIEEMCLIYKESPNKENIQLQFTQPNMEGGHFCTLQQFILSAKQVFRGKNETEFYMFDLPRTVHFSRDISRYLITSKQFGQLVKGINLQLVTYRKVGDTYEPMAVAGKLESIRTTLMPDLTDDNKLHTYLDTIYYDMPTLSGDCGSPVLIDSDSFANKLLGFHFAGLSGKGIACPMTIEDIKDLVKDEMYLADPQHLKLEETPDFPLKNSSFYSQGYATEKISHPCKTSLITSEVHGLFGEPKTFPAVLGPPLEEGGPMLKALMKNAGNVTQISDLNRLEEVKQDYFQTCIAPFTPKPVEQSILDFRTACCGIEGDDYFPPIKRGKSAGYPYMAKAKKGKEDWFGRGDWDFSSPECKELRKDVHELIEKAKYKQVPEVIFVATLKDEKRSVEKVMAKKTRVFSACPQHFLIAFRQYFGGFIAFMGRNKIHNESAIGTNAHGRDWTELVKHLTPWSEQNISAGDFSDFDGTFQPQVMEALLSSINNFYQGSAEDDQVRKSLWSALVNPMHLLDKFIFTFSHGQPSGSPITAISNSMYVSHCVRYILWNILKENKITFRNHVKMIAYGDDSLISLSPFLASLVSSHQIADLFKTQLSMNYTSAKKTLFTPEDKFQHISEVSFLKRGFSYDKDHMHWYAPLEMQSIEEMCNWTRKSPSNETATIDNCESAIKELCHHPFEIFDQKSRIISNACKNKSLLVHVPNWNFVRTQMSLGQSDYMTNCRPFV